MRVVIIGGGPSGAFCAMGLLRGDSGRMGEVAPHGAPEVVLLDRKIFSACGPRGCNVCAGVISNSLLTNLKGFGMEVPREVIQREIQGYHFISLAGSAHLRKDPTAKILTAYRALGPPDSAYSEERSFDHFLLQQAVDLGARHLRELVTNLVPPRGKGAWRVEYGQGEHLDADIVVAACGVHTPFLSKITDLCFGYRPPLTIHACQAEVPLDPEAVTECFRDEIIIFALGLPGIKFAAMTPKERHVTVTLVGRYVKRQHLEEFLQLPPVRSLFPRTWRLPAAFCHCHPKIPVTAAPRACTDRLVVIGDAHVSRYLKNGLNSAFQTGTLAARAILETGGEARGLNRHYVLPCRQLFIADNLIGRLLFRLHGGTERSPRIARALLRGHPTRALWNMFTGDLPYMETMKSMLHPAFAFRAIKDMVADG